MIVHRTIAIALAILFAGCAASLDATRLAGVYEWRSLDGRAAPVEFPAGSGTTLRDGTLELSSAPAARVADAGGRYVLSFTTSTDDSSSTSKLAGRFRIAGDSLLFTPNGRGEREPVRFTVAAPADDRLELTDEQGHVWGWRRRP